MRSERMGPRVVQVARPALPVLRAGFEASGSGRWLMRTIATYGLDHANGFRLHIELAGDEVHAGLQATEACLAGELADVVDTDWLSIARCRQGGVKLAAAAPYGAIFGGLVARRGAIDGVPASCGGGNALPALRGKRIGVVHAHDKNYLLLRGACLRLHGFDLDNACTRVEAGSKTALQTQLADGRVDAALLYWHQIPALVATGEFVELCDLLDMLPLLGMRAVPSTFFVFPDALLVAQPALVHGFCRAAAEAMRILRFDAGAWHAVTGTEAQDAHARGLRAKWLARVGIEWDGAMPADLLALARCLGIDELPDGVYAAGFL